MLSGWVRLPLELRFGGIAEYATGRPYNITTGVDNNGDGANTDRPVIDGHVVGRNAGRGDDLYQLTLFLERDFPVGFGTLGLRGEVFNVTNHQNVVGYNGVYGNDPVGHSRWRPSASRWAASPTPSRGASSSSRPGCASRKAERGSRDGRVSPCCPLCSLMPIARLKSPP